LYLFQTDHGALSSAKRPRNCHRRDDDRYTLEEPTVVGTPFRIRGREFETIGRVVSVALQQNSPESDAVSFAVV